MDLNCKYLIDWCICAFKKYSVYLIWLTIWKQKESVFAPSISFIHVFPFLITYHTSNETKNFLFKGELTNKRKKKRIKYSRWSMQNSTNAVRQQIEF